ncbi:hypothetical protein TNIN_164481 [Trichonephila inaurata madagascariensis]|uniref:Uncharacterized protein n=1 Tax=Trichonephila inaurata madagascariensis TaxID=2747483 RepID=A0A8X6M7T1_9ARAC|nr:hypothetical protein TNIN_164481 [Trichonephila inaurata madagascariensis]
MSSSARSVRASNGSGSTANVADPFEEAVTLIQSIIEGVKKANDENKWQECVGNFDYSSMIRLLRRQSSHFKKAFNRVKNEENFKRNDKVVKCLDDLAAGLSKSREFLRPFVPLIREKRSCDTCSNELLPYNEGRRIYGNLDCLMGKGISIYSKDIPDKEFKVIDKLANGFIFIHVSPTWKDSGEDETITVSMNGIEIAVQIRIEKLVQNKSRPLSFSARLVTASEEFEQLNNELKKDFNNITEKINLVN